MFLHYGGVEAKGISSLKFRNVVTGEVTNSIIQVQSKATQQTRLQAKREISFEYRWQAAGIMGLLTRVTLRDFDCCESYDTGKHTAIERLFQRS